VIARRQILHAVGALAVLPALAQQPGGVRRIGYFTLGTTQSSATWLAAFREGMAALRWVEGRDYTLDARHAEGVAQAGPGAAADLVASKPDLLLASGDAAAHLLAEKTKTIPIVFCIVQDPVGSKLAASLQRPGGNLTGLTSLGRELGAKRLQLMREAIPRVSHVAVLLDPGNIGSVAEVKDIQAGAAVLKMRVTALEIRQPADIELAFKRGAALGVHAYMATQSGVINAQRKQIADRSLSAGRPSMGTDTQYVEAGGMMSYATAFEDNYRRAAGFVDKILKGAKPGELPIEQPLQYELTLNLKTAKAMKLAIPQAVLLRASRVIE
jgi:putative ABC transport system substrate-binding protein